MSQSDELIVEMFVNGIRPDRRFEAIVRDAKTGCAISRGLA
jgi:hypothetical protein